MLSNKTAIVTGSSRGIGRAIALKFAENGANVVLNHTKDGQDIEQTCALLDKMPANYLVCRGSVTDVDFVNDMVGRTLERFESVTILVNNAGIVRDRPLMIMPESDWDQVIDTNLKGAYVCSKAVLRPMIQQKSGRIINISSISAISGRQGQCNYAAAKAGLVGMTKSMARESGKYGILVNALLVGLVDTLMTKRMPLKALEEVKKIIPLGRIGQPEEVAGVCLFLASDLSSFVTGTTINVSGGGYI